VRVTSLLYASRRARVVLLAVATALIADRARAEPLGKRIDAVMQPWSRANGPGCSVAVMRNGKVIHEKGYGRADLEHDAPNTPDTVYEIASTSKQFTAVMTFLLAADGRLNVDDDVREFLPELQPSTPPITIRHLLTHTSGIRDYGLLMTLAGSGDRVSSADALRMLARQRGLDFTPGEQFLYSNTGYFLLSQIIERAGGASFPQLAADRIFKPLGMSRSHLHDDLDQIVPGRAISYAPGEGADWRMESSRWSTLGDAGVYTTVRDLARWAESLQAQKLGGEALQNAMQARVVLPDGRARDFGSGLMFDTYRGQPIVFHPGAYLGYRAELLQFPQQRTHIAVLCNAASASAPALARAVADVVLEKVLASQASPPASVPLTAAELDSWAGSYRSPTSGRSLEIAREESRLRADRLKFTALSPHEFEGSDSMLTVHLRFAGRAPERTLIRSVRSKLKSHSEPERFEESRPFVLAPPDMQPYTGRYRSAELDTDWMITIESGALHVHRLDLNSALSALAADMFVAENGCLLEMTRERGTLNGFTVRCGALHGLWFERVGPRRSAAVSGGVK
jgi:CubicO group peptidase (beta-lactamase class C family)